MKSLKFICTISIFYCYTLTASDVQTSKTYNIKFKAMTPQLEEKKLQPYVVLGKKYKPFIPPIGHTQVGNASWYGTDDGFNNKLTSSGEIYDKNSMTAAHKTLPMNTIVKVTDINTKQSVIVRISDRGPFKDNRVIDLSEKAAKLLNIKHLGVSEVIIKVLEYDPYITNKLGKGKVKASLSYDTSIKAFSIQIGNLKNSNSIEYILKTNKNRFPNKKVIAVKDKNSYKIVIVPFNSIYDARKYRDNYAIKGFPMSYSINSAIGKEITKKLKENSEKSMLNPTKDMKTKTIIEYPESKPKIKSDMNKLDDGTNENKNKNLVIK